MLSSGVQPASCFPPGRRPPENSGCFFCFVDNVGDDGFAVEDYDCDGNVAEDDDLGVTQGYKKKYVFCVIF